MTEHVARLFRGRNGTLQASLLARIQDDGTLVPLSGRSTALVLTPTMQLGREGTIWRVRPSPRTPMTIAQAHDVHSDLLGSTSMLKPKSQARLSDGIRLQFEEAAAASVPFPKGYKRPTEKNQKNGSKSRKTSQIVDPMPPLDEHASDLVIDGRATRLPTALILDQDVDAAGHLFTGYGTDFAYECPPDFVGFEDGWLRSSGWSVSNGKLKGPLSPDERLSELLDLGPRQSVVRGEIDGLTILDPPVSIQKLRWVDWRSDEQIVADARKLLTSLASPSNEGTDADMIAAALAGADMRTEKEIFEIERLVEVCRRRGRLTRDAAEVLFATSGLDELIAIERAEIRREAMQEAESDAALERQRVEADLETAKRELAETEAKLRAAREQEEAVRRAQAEIKADLHDWIGSKIEQLGSSIDGRLSEKIVKMVSSADASDMLRREIEELRESVGILEVTLATRSAPDTSFGEVADAIHSVGAQWLEAIGDRAKGQAPPIETRVTPVGDVESAMAAFRRQAHAHVVDPTSLLLAASISFAGAFPLYVGGRANAAAKALVASVAGEDYHLVHCDPTMISASDLLDEKSVRSSVLLNAMEQARSRPDRLHAVAFLSIDRAPCSYWLPALSDRRYGSVAIPTNLLMVGALAPAGEGIPLPSHMLSSAIPVDAGEWNGPKPLTESLDR